MPEIRHEIPREENLILRSLAMGLPSAVVLRDHDHEWPQLIYATRGVLTVRTNNGSWVVPSHRGVFIPAAMKHGIETTGSVRLRTLYFRPHLAARGLPESCSVIDVTPLLRELIRHIISLHFLDGSNPAHRRLAAVVIDQLASTPEAPLELSLPTDPRARRVADSLISDPSSTTTLEDMASRSGASVRTLERLFLQETSMSFGRWRRQARLLHALRCLADGQSVTAVAHEVGYDSASAFIDMFKKSLGTTPGRYFKPRHGEASHEANP